MHRLLARLTSDGELGSISNHREGIYRWGDYGRDCRVISEEEEPKLEIFDSGWETGKWSVYW